MTDVFPGLPFSPIQPGAYSVLDTTAIAAAQVGPRRKVVALLGAATGGTPNSPLFVYSQQALKQLLRSGPLYELARLAMIGGSNPVCVVRAGAGILPATAAIASAGGTALNLTTALVGALANSVKYSVVAGALIVQFTDPDTGVTSKETYTPTASGAAIPAQIVAMINGLVPGVAKSTLIATATVGANPAALSTAGSTAFTGGSDGTLSGGDWTTALTALEPTDISIVVPATEDATIHAQVTTHCVNMSQPSAKRERTSKVGGAIAETVSQVLARAATTGVLNRRTQLVYPGVKLFDSTGTLTLLSPMYAAAYLAGRTVALTDEATSMTHQFLDDIVDVEVSLSTLQGSDIDKLLSANVCVLAPADGGGIWVVDDLTLEPNDPTYHDVCKVRSLDEVSQRLRTRVNTEWVGKKGLSATAGSIAQTAKAELDVMKAAQLIRDFQAEGIVVQQDPAQANTFSLHAPVMPVDTVKFVPITIAIQPAATAVAGSAN